MERKLLLALTLFLFILASCGRKPAARPVAFVHDVVIPTTPVKNQAQSPLCWAEAMLATMESERLTLGDSVNLSSAFIARQWLDSQALTCFLSRGATPISLRGTLPMLCTLMERYGMVPYDSYADKAFSSDAVGRTLRSQARSAATLSDAEALFTRTLDDRLGYLPGGVFMLGAQYTPREFAHSVSLPGDWTAVTSFTHHPFGERIALELPDNPTGETFLNVPIDTLMSLIVGSLRQGHPVAWEGDDSEPGFSFRRGIAVLPQGTATGQAERQRGFETRRTTDDHCLELCGLAHDSHGRRFFLAKNSWGTDNPYSGFMYLSYDYVRLKTIAVVLRTRFVAHLLPQP